MRAIAVLMGVIVFGLPLRAQTSVTVAQLEHFLASSRTAKLSDAEIANRLSQVTLSEQMTARTLDRIRNETSLGPSSDEQLDLLAAASIFEPPPDSEQPSLAAPNAEEQRRIIEAARDYASRALHILPDFLAMRSTRYFSNVPPDYSGRNRKLEMQLTRGSQREIAFRDGHEIERALGQPAKALEGLNTAAGLSTWGEFGPILSVVLGDTTDESLRWKRWQTAASGIQLAVFRYAISRSSSHYTIDFCCFQKSLDDPADYRFRDKPAYAGEIYVDPANGEIDRITLDAELDQDGLVSRSAIAVQYGHVIIGGKQYVCPLWSIAVSNFHNALIEKIDGIGTERHLNETEFTNYHKFGSSSRILTEVGAGQPK